MHGAGATMMRECKPQRARRILDLYIWTNSYEGTRTKRRKKNTRASTTYSKTQYPWLSCTPLASFRATAVRTKMLHTGSFVHAVSGTPNVTTVQSHVFVHHFIHDSFSTRSA